MRVGLLPIVAMPLTGPKIEDLATQRACQHLDGSGTTTVVPREASNWCNIWVSHADESDLPRMLMIGDSITTLTESSFG